MKRIVTCILVFVLIFTCFPTVVFAAETRSGIGMADVGPGGYRVMTSSQNLVDVTKSMEGFSETPYWDYGQYTIGFGCNADQEEGFINKITVKEAEELLRRELKQNYEAQVNQCRSGTADPHPHRPEHRRSA